MSDDRDWDKEMAKIDRLIGKEPVPAAKGEPPAGVPTERTAPRPSAPRPANAGAVAQPSGSGARIRVWLMALLGAAGAGALLFWPYGKSCGTLLWVYLLGVVAVFGAAVVTMRAAWLHRRGIAMTIGILIFVASLALAAAEVLPRIGYAAVPLTWSCST